MFAGLPGTGPGALFYALLVCWMPFRELWLLARGRSSHGRWALVARQVGLVLGIVAALWAEAWAIKSLVGSAGLAADVASGSAGFAADVASRSAGLAADVASRSAAAFAVAAGQHLPPALAWTPFVVLMLLVGGLHLARLIVRHHHRATPANRQPPLASMRAARARLSAGHRNHDRALSFVERSSPED
jgi:hypothetical protein